MTVRSPGPPSRERRTVRAVGGAKGAFRFLAFLALLGSVHVLFMIGLEIDRMIETGRAIAELKDDIIGLEREVSSLEAVMQHGDDELYREELARRQGFIFPDELRVVTLQQSKPF